MADAYQGYNKVNETRRCCCFAHISRYLLEAIPKGHEKDYSHPAVQGVLYCNKLFEYERIYKEKGLSYKQIGNRRLKDQKPVVEGLLAWVNQVIPGDNAKLRKNRIRKLVLGIPRNYALTYKIYPIATNL